MTAEIAENCSQRGFLAAHRSSPCATPKVFLAWHRCRLAPEKPPRPRPISALLRVDLFASEEKLAHGGLVVGVLPLACIGCIRCIRLVPEFLMPVQRGPSRRHDAQYFNPSRNAIDFGTFTSGVGVSSSM